MLAFPITLFSSSGGFETDIHQPAGTTALLRAGFSANATAAGFDTNTISGAVTGTLTHNSTGGLGDGGYASGWSFGTNFINFTSQGAVDSSSSNWLTLIAAIKTTESGAAVNAYGPKVVVFGDSAGSVRSQFGVSSGNMHLAANNSTPQGTIDVDDGNWHLIAWQQTSQTSWNMWVDGTKDSATASTPNHGNEAVNNVGSGYTPYTGTVAPTDIDGVQIYKPSLSDSELTEVFTKAGY